MKCFIIALAIFLVGCGIYRLSLNSERDNRRREHQEQMERLDQTERELKRFLDQRN